MDAGPQTFLAPRLLDLATTTGQLTPAQCRLVGGLLDHLDRQRARKEALARAVAILDPRRESSRWALALRLEAALTRFDGTPRRRVLAGYRPPTALETCLVTLIEVGGPRCASKLWAEIRDLPNRG